MNYDRTARGKLWAVGVIAAWYLRFSQLDVYELILRERFAFVEAARRFGKTNTILAFVLEQLIQHPGWICVWCFPFKNQAREVLMAEMAKIQKENPEYNQFKYETTDSFFGNANNSKLKIRGVNEDRGESARGAAANIIVCDEYGFWNEPRYIVREVLYPQLENQEGRWLIKTSTPPRNMGHPYYEEREIAIKKGRFIRKTIYDNEALGKEELAEIIEECGGVESPAFRRERLCEDVIDPTLQVVPEYSDLLGENVVPDDYPRPEFFDAYAIGDNGVDDNAAFLFGYYDFIKNEAVIEDEYVIAGATSKAKTDECKKREVELWSEQKPYVRKMDGDAQTLLDFTTTYGYETTLPEKKDRLAAIHAFRDAIRLRKFKVKAKCKILRRQLRVGQWKDDKHSDLERSEDEQLRHLDALMAGVYFNRSIDKTHNPWPLHHGLNRETHFIPPTHPVGTNATLGALLHPYGRR